MLNRVRDIAKTMLVKKQADGVLGLIKGEWDIIRPHIFERPEEVDAMVIEPKWLLAKMAISILRSSRERYRLAVVARGCDERALTELMKRNQIERERLGTIGIACTADQARSCICSRPFPERLDAGEAISGVDPYDDDVVKGLLAGDASARMEKWARVLNRCIKCYGCRNSCPICVCIPCKLEDEVWVEKGVIPAEMMSYHFIRAFHLSDTCVACGACQDACPVNIPLVALQLSMREFLRETYGYEAGLDPERRSPILYDLHREPAKGQALPDWINTLREDDEP
ncbi:MAG TPA: 4Fe-4S binding protein [Syntrophales bacterium]|nr:4Fe-4S binding protein [Syntrophales bacterium]